METPGHAPEHLAFVLTDRDAADAPLAVFSGDSLKNATGQGLECAYQAPRPMTAAELHESWDGTILDLRDQAGFAGRHIPGSLTLSRTSTSRC